MSPVPLAWALGSAPHGSSWLACWVPQKLLEPLKRGLDVQHKDLFAHLVFPSQQAPLGTASDGVPCPWAAGDEVTQPWPCRVPSRRGDPVQVVACPGVSCGDGGRNHNMSCCVPSHPACFASSLCHHPRAAPVPQWHVPPSAAVSLGPHIPGCAPQAPHAGCPVPGLGRGSRSCARHCYCLVCFCAKSLISKS